MREAESKGTKLTDEVLSCCWGILLAQLRKGFPSPEAFYAVAHLQTPSSVGGRHLHCCPGDK